MMRSRLFGALGVVAIVAAACSSSGATPSPSAAAASQPAASAPAASGSAPAASGSQAAGGKQWKIGYSNGGGVGNGFREEQVCTAKAEALASGAVSQLTTIHRNTDANGQLQDIRDLIAAGVDAIVFNPNDPAALTPALDEAKAAGIKTVAVDQFVTHPDTYQLFNNQIKYAELGAKWLFDKLGGTGTVWYQRGFAGAGADTDRDTGFQNILKDYPNIQVLPNKQGVATQWDPAITTQVTNDFIASGDYDKTTGVWTSGMDVETIDAIKASGKKFVPLVGTDRGGSVTKFLDDTGYPGLDGAAVTNTAAVGGAGVALAIKLLNGETVQTDPTAAQPNTVLLDPVLADDQTAEGKATLQSWLVDGLDPAWPLGLKVEGYTHYTPEQAIACKGPND
ncbi:MAG: substrate-binding domain-containing protein [Chloroflexota bacterium]